MIFIYISTFVLCHSWDIIDLEVNKATGINIYSENTTEWKESYYNPYNYPLPFWVEYQYRIQSFPSENKELAFDIDKKRSLKQHLTELQKMSEFNELKMTNYSFVKYLPELLDVVREFTAELRSFVIKPAKGYRARGVIYCEYNTSTLTYDLFKLQESDTKLELMEKALPKLVFNIASREISNHWTFTWGGVSWGYVHGMIVESLIPSLNNVVPEVRFHILYGEIFTATYYENKNNVRMIWNRNLDLYESLFNITLQQFVDLLPLVEKLISHFQFHWGRIDFFYDVNTHNFLVNEVQANGTDHFVGQNTWPYFIDYMNPCTQCMEDIVSSGFIMDFHTTQIEPLLNQYWGINPFKNQIGSRLWKEELFEEFIIKVTKEKLHSYCAKWWPGKY